MATIAAVVIGWNANRNASDSQDSDNWIVRAEVVFRTLEQARVDAFSAVTALQTYYQGDDIKSLDNFSDLVSTLQREAAMLRALTRDNATQQQRLDQVDRTLQRMSDSARGLIQSAKTANRQPPLSPASFTRLDNLLIQFRDELAGMSLTERRLLADRAAIASSNSRQSMMVTGVGGSIILAWLLLVGGYAGLTSSRLQKASQALLASREALAISNERHKAEERFRALLEAAPDAMVIVDEAGSIVLVNAQTESLFGYTRTGLLGQRAEMLVPVRLRDQIPHLSGGYFADPKARATGAGLGLYGLRKNGTEFPVEISLSPLETEEGTLVCSAIRDVTNRKKAEETLRRSEDSLRLAAENVKDYAILTLDLEGRVTSWNAGAQRVKGYTADEIIGHHSSRFYTAEDVAAKKPAYQLEMARRDGSCQDEGRRVRKDGSRFWADIIITTLYSVDGKINGFSNVTRDSSERKKIEEELRARTESERRHTAQLEAVNKELEAFSYSVSHDLRTPLRSIDGFSLALLEDYADKLDAGGKEFLRRIRTASQRMALLIDDLLKLSRISRDEMRLEVVDLSAMAKDILDELQQQEPGRQVECVIPGGIKAQGDSHLLRAALENLLGNAWKFTSKKPVARIELGVSRLNGQPVYFVRDDGAGFDMSFAGKLFGAFQRLHSAAEFPGTGVGLATVQRVVFRHGGSISAEGAAGKGATFSFTLPENQGASNGR